MLSGHFQWRRLILKEPVGLKRLITALLSAGAAILKVFLHIQRHLLAEILVGTAFKGQAPVNELFSRGLLLPLETCTVRMRPLLENL